MQTQRISNFFNLPGLVLKEEVSLCGYRAFKTQIAEVLVIINATMVTEEELKGKDISQYTELQTAIGHTFVITQVKAILMLVSL